MAVRFDNSADYLRRQVENICASAASMSGCCWVKRKVDTGTWATWWFVQELTTLTLQTYMETEGGGDTVSWEENPGTVSILTGPTLTIDTWFFLAWRRTNTARKLYWGTEAGGTLSTAVNSDTRNVSGDLDDLWLGNDPSTEPFNGEIAYVRLWDAELTDAEIDAEWRSTTPVKTANLRGDWRLAAAASAGTDSSGNSLTLTANGTLTDGGSDPTPPASGPADLNVAVVPSDATYTRNTLKIVG